MYQIDENYNIVELSNFFVEHLLTRYVPTGSLIVTDTMMFYFFENASTFDLSPYPYVIFNFSGNPLDAEYFLPRIKQLNLKNPYYILSGSFNYWANPPSDPHIIFFPFWLIWSSHLPSTVSSLPKKYTVSCLNGTPWNHRKLTYLALNKQPWFNQIIFTFGHRSPHHPSPNDPLTKFEEDQFYQLEQEVEFIPEDITVGIDVSINHPAFLETYVNLVTETTCRADAPMLSEKTFKPILSGQLFILIASAGAVDFLRATGIDVFDDIIDHRYDSLPDTRDRILHTVEQIDRLIDANLSTLYENIKPRLIANNRLLKSDQYRKTILANYPKNWLTSF